MSELPAQGSGPGFEAQAGASDITAGTLLRQAREQSGWHVATMAAALKVPVRKLEALEADRFDLLPDLVFVRALAASVCRNLKIDPAPVLQRLPATAGPQLAASEGRINAPFRSPRDGASPNWSGQFPRPVLLAVMALLLGALVLFLLPLRRDDVARQPESAAAPAPDAAATPAATPAAAAVAPVALAAPSASAPDPGPSSGPGLQLSASALSPSAAALAATSAADGVVVFRAKAPSWVQVTDAKGAVTLRKLLVAGESATASGALPLAVTVGSASATDVQVRGKPFDLAPLSRNNVARFEVQ